MSKLKRKIIVSFHIGRGGRFYNGGHKTYLGEKNFQDLISNETDHLYIRNKDERGKFMTPTLFDGNGNVVSDDNVNSLIGTLNFDGDYDTYGAKYIEDGTTNELELISKANEHKSGELEYYLDTNNYEKI